MQNIGSNTSVRHPIQSKGGFRKASQVYNELDEFFDADIDDSALLAAGKFNSSKSQYVLTLHSGRDRIYSD